MTLKKAIPSALELRDMLEEMAVRELRGPVQGEDEEVPGRIRDRYLVGILAPRQRAEDDALPLFDKPATPPAEDDDNLEGDFPPGDEHGRRRGRAGQPRGRRRPDRADALDVQGRLPVVAGAVLLRPARRHGPQGHAPLGTLRKAPSDFLTNPKTGTPKRVWKRQPCGAPARDPAQGRAGRTLIADEAFPDAKIKGLIRRRTDHWSVTLFLVNEQQEPPPPNGNAPGCSSPNWWSRPRTAPPVFHKRHTRST